MTSIDEKIKEYADRLEKEDADKIIPELSTYLEGIADNEKDSIKRELIHGLILTLTLYQGLIVVAIKLKKETISLKSQHNSLLERFNKLEQKFNDEIARK